VVWVARYTGRDGKRRVAKPSWNRGKGTFVRKSEAQRAIDEAYEIAATPDTLGEYFATWIERHPRSERTNATYEHRVSRVTDVEIEGIALKDWPMHELRRRHTLALVDHLLTNEGRAATGANDPRAQKKPRPIRVFTFEEMHRFAKAAGRYEAMVRVFTDTGLRSGRFCPCAVTTSTARSSRSAAPPTRGGFLKARRPTTASPTPVASFPSPRPSPGCSKPRSTSTTLTAS
jgi:integrase